MPALAAQIAHTFFEDAAALVNGFGRIVTHMVMAPIERIANACDVTGVLERRRASYRRRLGIFRRLSPFRSLSELT
jgi:hypothetical protein